MSGDGKDGARVVVRDLLLCCVVDEARKENRKLEVEHREAMQMVNMV
jgi:hypothetical protein